MKIKDWIAVTYNIDEWRVAKKENQFCLTIYDNPEKVIEKKGEEEIDYISIELEDDGGWVIAEIFTK